MDSNYLADIMDAEDNELNNFQEITEQDFLKELQKYPKIRDKNFQFYNDKIINNNQNGNNMV